MINKRKLSSLQELPFKNEIINDLGGTIYSVGGAVRDELLKLESKDLDILITGVPLHDLERVLSKYGDVNAVGKSFGILKFRLDGNEIDIAIPRTEKPTGDGGHKDFEVISNHKLPIKEDLRRRDFTLNAIAKDVDGNLIDPFNGREDLRNKIIRVVNDDAFADDPLRMLRAVQFAARFKFKIEPVTLKLINENAHQIKNISSERILTEFNKIVKKGDILTGVHYLIETKLLKNIVDNDNEITFKSWNKIKSMSEFIFFLLRDNVDSVSKFYKNTLNGSTEIYNELKAFEHGMDEIDNNLFKNRMIAYKMYKISPNSLNSKLLPLPLQKAANELISEKYPKKINELEIDGNDLMELGFEGKEIGDKLKSLLTNIYADNIKNNREDLLNLLGDNT